MQQIRQILQMHLRGVSLKSISRQTSIRRNTVKGYVRRWQSLGLPEGALAGMEDSALSALLLPPPKSPPGGRYHALDSYLSEHLHELSRKGVTRRLLWEEYRACHADGYAYTQFCEHLGRRTRHLRAVMHFEHRAGEKMMVDFAGQTLHYIEPMSGQKVECQVFVANLPCSGHLYVMAVPSQQLPDFVHCLGSAFAYFGGVVECVQSDNLRSAVKRADRYEPQLTDAMEQLGAYYDCTFMAARPAKPRDKASVERHVQIAYQHIFAPLRNEAFGSLAALNGGIAAQLRLLCDRPLQGQGGDTRRSRFERDERPCLRPLPLAPFEMRYAVPAKVQKNYHVLLGRDRHFYSVPYQYIGQQASIVHTSKNVEIYIGNQCVAAHPRARGHGYSTTKGHMPPHHGHFAERRAMTGEDYLRQARDIGPNCEATVQGILNTKAFHEQAFNSCTGIIRLAAKFTPQRLENACARANKAKAATYTIVRNILQNNLDMAPQAEEGAKDIPRHHNIRGPMAYA